MRTRARTDREQKEVHGLTATASSAGNASVNTTATTSINSKQLSALNGMATRSNGVIPISISMGGTSRNGTAVVVKKERDRSSTSFLDSPMRRKEKINKTHEDRMNLIAKVVLNYTDEVEKLFDVVMWKSLIKNATKGTEDEKKFNRNDELLTRWAESVIDQIISKEYVERVGEFLRTASSSNTRRGRSSSGEDRFLKFLLLAQAHEETKNETVTNRALGEESESGDEYENVVNSETESDHVPDENQTFSEVPEGEKENLVSTSAPQSRRVTRNSIKAIQTSPLRVQSSQSQGVETPKGLAFPPNGAQKQTPLTRPICIPKDEFYSRAAATDVLGIGKSPGSRRSPVLNPNALYDEIIENDTPPPTPTGCEPEPIIPRKRTRLSSSSREFERLSSSTRILKNKSDISGFGRFGISDRGDDSVSRGRDSGTEIEDPVKEEELLDIDIPETGRDKENLPRSEQEILRDYPRPLTCPELKPYMFEEIEEALSRPRKDKIVTSFGLTLMQEHLAVYNKSEWLEDVNIDFYLEMIKYRNNRDDCEYPRVYIFQSYFYKVLERAGYDEVQGATDKWGKKDNIFEYDLLLIPIHSDHHWVLVAVDFTQKTMLCYDSMDHNNEKHLRTVVTYLKREWKAVTLTMKLVAAKLDGSVKYSNHTHFNFDPMFIDASDDQQLFLGESWTIKSLGAEDIPQQKNGRDCGIFCLQFAEYLSRKQPFDFEQKHTAYFRKRMLYETLKQTLLIP